MKRVIKFGLVFGAITAVARLIGSKIAEWDGMTEAEVRRTIDERLPDKVDDAKRRAVADKIVERLRSRGKLLEA
jgi:hypothetical protein